MKVSARKEPDKANRGDQLARGATPTSSQRISAYQVMTEAS